MFVWFCNILKMDLSFEYLIGCSDCEVHLFSLLVCFQSMMAIIYRELRDRNCPQLELRWLWCLVSLFPLSFTEGTFLRQLSGKYTVKLLFIACKFYKLYLGAPNAEMCLAIALLSSISVKNNYRIWHWCKMPTF